METGGGKSIACRLVSPNAFWATQVQTCWADWSCGVADSDRGDDRGRRVRIVCAASHRDEASLALFTESGPEANVGTSGAGAGRE